MDLSLFYSIGIPLIVTGVIVFFVFKHKKYEPLTYPEFFLRDKNPKYIHVLGAKRVMPDEGDSFDIFEHYVFDLEELKFTKGEGLRGKDLNLGSEFVKRNLQFIGQKLNAQLAFMLPPEEDDEDYEEEVDEYEEQYEDENEEQKDVLKIYNFDDDQSDTEVHDELNNDNLTFIKQNVANRDRFTMILCRRGREVRRYEMSGVSDYFFKTIYLEGRSWLCFLYQKQKNVLKSGIALCILNYETGDMIYNEFVKPGKA